MVKLHAPLLQSSSAIGIVLDTTRSGRGIIVVKKYFASHHKKQNIDLLNKYYC